MKMKSIKVSLCAALVFWMGFGASDFLSAQALVVIETVPVGNTGNPAASPSNAPGWGSNYGFGAVDYNYRIGKTEVTINQYVTFLNAVATAPTTDFEEELWISTMETNYNIAGILRSGQGTPASPYSFSVVGTGTRPIAQVSFYGAAAFANWLHNGATSTSGIRTGAYTISEGAVTQVSRTANLATVTSPGHTVSPGDQVTISDAFGYNGSFVVTAVAANTFSFAQLGSDQAPSSTNGRFVGASATRNENAAWWIPSENEWIKAAFYIPTGNGIYTLYANQSDAMTTNFVGSGGGANFRDFFGTGWAVTQSLDFDEINYLTEVGAYGSTLSYYGTLDQSGNLSEWNETIPTLSLQSRVLRGGNWGNDIDQLRASHRGLSGPAARNGIAGFRVATLGEPSTNLPPPSNTAPTLALRGPAKIRTNKSRVTISGTASDSGGVASVLFRVGSKGGFKTAKGTTSWQISAKLKPGKNVVEIYAVDPQGLKSPTTRFLVVFKKKP
jgi:sulfatase modifying factor 1